MQFAAGLAVPKPSAARPSGSVGCPVFLPAYCKTFTLCLTGGLRVSELVGLRIDELRFDGRYVELFPAGRWTGG